MLPPRHEATDTPALLVTELQALRQHMIDEGGTVPGQGNVRVVERNDFRIEFGGRIERLMRAACLVPPDGGAPDQVVAKLAAELKGLYLGSLRAAEPVADEPESLKVALIPLRFGMRNRLDRLEVVLGLRPGPVDEDDREPEAAPSGPAPR